jgi:hypothetical protein
MPGMLCWLCYRVDGRTEIVIQPGNGVVFVRLSAGIAGRDDGDFIEGHCLDEAMSARVAKNMVGKRLSAGQAKKLLDSLERQPARRRDKKETKNSSLAKTP